jgi:Tol biopolymer transport system component
MPLTQGSRVGPYEITALIGEGGMGQVYRARDTKLDRDVALKVLPDSFVHDPDRLARFQREAKVLASLNHPNIAHIHGLEESNGVQALVMELVEGEDLAQRLTRGAIPIDEALPIARQIAEALEAAHEQGIIHRDLKPANIKVKPDGTVKVLDFGLAKALDPLPSSADVSQSPTITSPAMTQLGMILGTAAYMSPEQARGRPLDKRTDIWAFGCVLYEMFTGKRPFEDEDVSMTLSKVLQRDPDFDAFPSAVPARVTQVIRLCLRKDPKQRVGDIRDVRLALEGAFETAAPLTATSATSSASGRRLAWTAFALVAVLAAALAIPTVRHLLEAPLELRVVNTTILPPEGAEFDFGDYYALPALSPDGTRIVFGARANGKVELWVRRLDSPTAQLLPGTENASIPFWSPDSRWVAFGQGNKLKKIDIQGGPPVGVADLPAALRGGSWNKDGIILAGLNAPGPILRVPAVGGTVTTAASLDKGQEALSQRRPWFLPDGRHFIYYTRVPGSDMPVSVGSLDEPGKPGKVVAQTQSSVVYAQGHLLYVRENTLMAQPFDVDRLETTGEAVPVAERISTFSTSRYAAMAVSPDGSLVYLAGIFGGQSRLVWKDRQGTLLGNLGEPTGTIVDVELSPDGTRVATAITGATTNSDIWIYDVSRGVPTKFTFDGRGHSAPLWSPDGATVYYSAALSGTFDLVRQASYGSSREESLLTDSVDMKGSSVSPDGMSLLYNTIGFSRPPALFVLPLADLKGSPKPEPHAFLQTGFVAASGRFSADGQWVVYSSTESGPVQVYTASFPGSGGKSQISPSGGERPRWRKDGKEIFYATADGQLMAADIIARNGRLEVGKVQKLFDGIVMGRGYTYDVSADGQKFLVVDDGVTAVRRLTLLQNWTASLRK